MSSDAEGYKEIALATRCAVHAIYQNSGIVCSIQRFAPCKVGKVVLWQHLRTCPYLDRLSVYSFQSSALDSSRPYGGESPSSTAGV